MITAMVGTALVVGVGIGWYLQKLYGKKIDKIKNIAGKL